MNSITVNGARIELRPGQDANEVRKRYQSLFDKKAGGNYLDNNPKPPINIELEAEKAEIDWQINESIAYLYFKCNIETGMIAQMLRVPHEKVLDFVIAETECHKRMKRLRDEEESRPETLAETLKRLT